MIARYNDGMMKQISVLFAAGLLAGLFAPAARAQAVPINDRIALGPQIGTGGVGAELAVSLVPKLLNLDLGFSTYSLTGTIHVDGAPFRYKVRVGGVPIVLALYPFHNWFDLQAGLIINNNRASVVASAPAGESITIFGHTYTAASIGDVTGATNFAHAAPYFGIGFGQPFEGGRITFTGSFGVMLEGQPKVVLNVTNKEALLLPGAAAELQKDQNTINHDGAILATYPEINFGIVVRF